MGVFFAIDRISLMRIVSRMESTTVKLHLEEEIDLPQTQIEAPPKFCDLVENYSTGLRRIAITRKLGGHFQKVNAIKIVGAHPARGLPDELTEELLDLVMQVISRSIETSGEGGVYRLVTSIKQPSGKSKAGPAREERFPGFWDRTASSTEPDQRAEQLEMLRYLTTQNRHTLAIMAEAKMMMAEARQSMKSVAAYSETITGRLADALIAERQATRELAEAQAESIRAQQEHALELAKLEQRRELLELLGPALSHATEELGNKAAEKLLGKSPTPRTKPPEQPKAADLLSNLRGSDGRSKAEPKQSPLEAEATPNQARLRWAQALHKSITEDPERAAKARSALGDLAWSNFDAVSAATTDAEALAKIRAMMDGAKDGAIGELLGILTPDELTVIQHLRSALRADAGPT